MEMPSLSGRLLLGTRNSCSKPNILLTMGRQPFPAAHVHSFSQVHLSDIYPSSVTPSYSNLSTQRIYLLGSLVDLLEEAPEDLLLEAGLVLVDALDERVQLGVALLLVLVESALDVEVPVDLLDPRLGGRVLDPVRRVKGRALGGRRKREGEVDGPGALVVLQEKKADTIRSVSPRQTEAREREQETRGAAEGVRTRMSVPIFPSASGSANASRTSSWTWKYSPMGTRIERASSYAASSVTPA